MILVLIMKIIQLTYPECTSSFFFTAYSCSALTEQGGSHSSLPSWLVASSKQPCRSSWEIVHHNWQASITNVATPSGRVATWAEMDQSNCWMPDWWEWTIKIPPLHSTDTCSIFWQTYLEETDYAVFFKSGVFCLWANSARIQSHLTRNTSPLLPKPEFLWGWFHYTLQTEVSRQI